VGTPATCPGRSELDRKMALLEKRQAALRLALRQGREKDREKRWQGSELQKVITLFSSKLIMYMSFK
jgi:hypothetical protein